VLDAAAGEGAPRQLVELIMAKGFDPQRARQPQ